MMTERSRQNKTCYYFVDEAGDGTLFNKKKKTIVGSDGCSKYFILGGLEVADPEKLDVEMNQIRQDLLADSYLSLIPSMQPDRKKTASQFHAKDDCAEVRREVYKLLIKHELKFFAVVRDKRVLAKKVKIDNEK